jgi:PAS domain S-box-containing protein
MADRQVRQGEGLGWRRWLYALALPVGGALGALVLRAALEPMLAGDRPYLMVFPAVLLVTLAGGWAAGVVCMALSISAAWALFVPRDLRFTEHELLAAVLVMGVSLVLIGFGAWTRRLRVRSELAARDAGRALEQMRESEARFRRLAELSPDAILVLQGNRVVFTNPATLNLLGATDETQVIGHSPLELVHPDSRGLLEDRLGRLLATGAPNPPAEQRYYRFDGSVITVETTSNLVPWGGGTAVQVIARDVSERKQREEEVRESKEELERFFENSPVPIHWVDPEGRIVRANRAELDLLGYGRDEYIGRDIRDFHVDPERAARALAKLRAGETLRGFELQVRRKDGTVRDVLLDATTMQREGKMVHSWCFLVDVTEQRRGEEEVRSALDRFDLCARATSQVIYDWDIEKQHLQWNDAIHLLLENGVGEPINSIEWWTDRLHPDDRAQVLDSITSALQEGGQWTFEYRFRRADGTYAYVLDRAFIVRTREGKPVRMVGAMIDLTPQKEWERELARRATELEHSNAELQDFARVISHDLKEPLRGIAQYATTLREEHRDVIDEAMRDKLETIERLSRRMNDLLNALMEYAQLGHQKLRRSRTDLNTVLRDALDSLRSRIEEERVQVVVKSRLPEADCDPILLGQVFSNLIANAIKYNVNPAKRVEIGWRQADKEGEPGALYVRDNGIGIDPRHQETVFQMFRRLHARDQFGGGTGSGLSIVRKIVELHGGKVWLESEPGRGTTFYITLDSMREPDVLLPEIKPPGEGARQEH